jgi:hypothetical protein
VARSRTPTTGENVSDNAADILKEVIQGLEKQYEVLYKECQSVATHNESLSQLDFALTRCYLREWSDPQLHRAAVLTSDARRRLRQGLEILNAALSQVSSYLFTLADLYYRLSGQPIPLVVDNLGVPEPVSTERVGDGDTNTRLGERLTKAAIALEKLSPAIKANADNVIFASQVIGVLTEGSNVTGIKAAVDNCEYARRWLAGHEIDGADHAAGVAADLLRSVVGRVDPG